jgi:hypothetical protein
MPGLAGNVMRLGWSHTSSSLCLKLPYRDVYGDAQGLAHFFEVVDGELCERDAAPRPNLLVYTAKGRSRVSYGNRKMPQDAAR